MRIIRWMLLGLSILFTLDTVLAAEMKISRVSPTVELKAPLDIVVNNLEPVKDHPPEKFTLYLNGYSLAALKPKIDGRNTLRFMLDRPTDDDEESKASSRSWKEIIGAPMGEWRTVSVVLRYDGTVVEAQ